MRIVSYNILDGGEGRADPLAEVILAQRPDVVGLVEADDLVTLERIAKRLGMDYIQGVGPSHASALLSRWPIVETINHAAVNPKLTRSFLEAVVQDPAGVAWPIGVLHLPPGANESDEDARLEEIGVVLELFQSHRMANRPHLICGDFNSNAPYQKIDPAQCRAKTQKAWENNGRKLPGRVIEAITAAGYVDTYHARHDEKVAARGTFDTQHPGQRVDYIFAYGVEASGISDAWIEQDRLAKYASDHFPIAAQIG